MSEWRPVPGSEPLPDRERPVGHVLSGFAARLDPCVNWFKLLAATRGRILWIFPIVLLGAYLGALSQYNPIGDFRCAVPSAARTRRCWPKPEG